MPHSPRFSSTSGVPVVRFAPSPTGHLHMGNLRLALINWLYARSHGGRFILRFDDTDHSRSQDVYKDSILKDLEWLGLDWDKVVYQSDRFDHYEKCLGDLKAQGWVYDCYETEQDLSFLRRQARAAQKPFIYDRRSLNLSPQEKSRLVDQGLSPHWRFKLPHQQVSWHDINKGHTQFDTSLLSDPVIVRSDGSLLYLLASTFDDLDLGVNTIIRGDDHMTNSASQLMLYDVLGGNSSDLSLCHMPLLSDGAGTKLSKRLGSASLENLRQEGYERDAILTLLWGIGSNQPLHVHDLKGLQDIFDLSLYSSSSAVFHLPDLCRLNEHVVRHYDYEQVRGDLMDRGWQRVDAAFWSLISPNLSRFCDVGYWHDMVFGNDYPEHLDQGDFFRSSLAHFPQGEIDQGSWRAWTQSLSQATGLKGRDLYVPLRRALTGLERGPEIKDLLPLMGRDRIESLLGFQVK